MKFRFYWLFLTLSAFLAAGCVSPLKKTFQSVGKSVGKVFHPSPEKVSSPPDKVEYPVAGKEVVETMFYENGFKKSERTFMHGLLHGVSTTWWPNGQKMSETTYMNGVENGAATQWWQNGQKMCEHTYKNGMKDGVSRSWRNDGQLWTEYSYVAGKKDGPFQTWWENGQKRCEGTYKQEVRLGLYNEWNEKGEQVTNRVYELPPGTELEEKSVAGEQ